MDTETQLTSCHECDLLIDMPTRLEHKEKLYCPRCHHHLATGHKHAVDYVIAIGFSSLLMLVIANSYEFISINAQGYHAEMSLPEVVAHLYHFDYVLLGFIFFAFAVVFPALYIILLMILALPLLFKSHRSTNKAQKALPAAYRVWLAKIISYILPWSMSDVFLIGVLVSLIKLVAMAQIILGIAFWAYVCFVLGFTYIVSLIDSKRVWDWVYYESH